MDFRATTSSLLQRFAEQHVRYGLMGGFALGLWGAARSTVDLDLLVHRDDVGKIDAVMKELGYECRFRSENVSQYVSPLKVFGEVDFLHAFREASLDMLDRAVEKRIFNDELAIRVLLPEDLVGLKLQAIKNDPKRKEQDAADIRALLAAQKDRIEMSVIDGYAELLDAQQLLKEIVRA